MGRPRKRPLPIVGQEFGKWKVEIVGPKNTECRCTCGVVKLVYNYDLLDGKSISCNKCANSQRGSTLPRVHKRVFPEMDHSLYRRLRQLAANAIQRCTNIKNLRYDNYGGRGIRVYQQWIDDSSLFVKYIATLEGCDNTDLLLDRINNEGHYEPGNLRFATSSVSATNRRNKLMPNGRRSYVGEYRVGG